VSHNTLYSFVWRQRERGVIPFTAKGNPGERDLLVQKENSTLVVIEAVVCDRAVTQQWSRLDLTGHFQKLLAYSTCRLFFHLTYSYVEDPASVRVSHLKGSARRDAPAGFTFQALDDILLVDSQPLGFVARYSGQLGQVHVVFLILDLFQGVQRQAAKTAASNNPRLLRAGSRLIITLKLPYTV
jgi:hypothetical protein